MTNDYNARNGRSSHHRPKDITQVHLPKNLHRATTPSGGIVKWLFLFGFTLAVIGMIASVILMIRTFGVPE